MEKSTVNTIISIVFFFAGALMVAIPAKSKIDELQSELTIYKTRITPPCPEMSYENFLNHLGGIGNKDTAFTGIYVKRDVNHWVPGKTKVDTVTTKYEVHISVTEDLK